MIALAPCRGVARRRPVFPRAAGVGKRRPCLRLVSLALVFTAPSAAEPVVLAGRAMGTTWTVKFFQPSPPMNPATLQVRIAARLEQLEQTFSTYRPSSELSRFNAAASTGWIAVTPDLARVALDSRRLSGRTEGAFDATVAPLVALWGFGPQRRLGPPPAPAEIAAARARVDWRRLEARLDPPALRKSSPEVAADFSSMAKGFAADAVGELLRTLGATEHYAAVGGDIRTGGAHRWRAGLEHPADDRAAPIAVVGLAGHAVSTSGDARNFFLHEGRRYGHLIDPRTGAPADGALAAVSVVAATCAASSSIATALGVLGAEAGFAWAVRERIAAIFVVREGAGFALRPTPEFAQFAWPGGN